MSNYVTLEVKGANEMNVYVAKPKGDGPFPAVIVFQEAFGVNAHIRDVTQRIAAEGYIAIAPELFHRTADKGLEIAYSDFSAVQPHLSVIGPESIEADTWACYDWLQEQDDVIKDKIGSIGFCLGGRASFIANSTVPLAAAISFYGGGMQNVANRAENLNGPMLLFWGGKDQHIKPEFVQTVVNALNEAQKPYINVVISYADHAFFCDARGQYHPEAAKEAWGMVKAFLKNKLG